MASFIIRGGNRVFGEIDINGAKNSALPILSASILCKKSVVHNCPRLTDVEAACNILTHLGSEIKWEGNTVEIDSSNIICNDIPDKLMREMRSSIVFMGAIVAKCKKAKISYPGGCELGPRPIDIHIAVMKKLGVSIDENHGFLDCVVNGEIEGTNITLPFPSVGATENAMITAVTAKGETVIYNAAREPEILDLANFLNACGGKIKIEKTGTIVVSGVEKLNDYVEHTVISDRVEAATFLCAAAISGGEILIRKAVSENLTAVTPVLEEMGCFVKTYDNEIYLKRSGILKPARKVRTMPYPGFPTDAQSPLMAVTTLADGISIFIENIFESRYKHVTELVRMGANIKVEGRVAVVEGVDKIYGAKVQCTDLRGGAALCIAAIGAEGESVISEIRHIERGYENFDKRLKKLGINIEME
ncbi:MAG: UDP-N-acetylglucosamine 1-carboxyvinyltransferase [Oscillospiraceae bacterium]